MTFFIGTNFFQSYIPHTDIKIMWGIVGFFILITTLTLIYSVLMIMKVISIFQVIRDLFDLILVIASLSVF